MKNKIKKAINYIKKHKKLRIASLTIISILSLFLVVNLGRYVKTIIENYISRTQNFYFNSDKLTEDNKQFEITYWSGVESYPLTIEVNSLDNNLRGADIPITYNISCSSNGDLLCNLSKTQDTIDTLTHSDSFVVTAVPNKVFEDGDSASITVSAVANAPYRKVLSATFTFIVGSYGLSYKIEDTEGQPYLESVISNTVDYYKVITAFGSYAVGAQISAEVYDTLSTDDKAKCASAIITLSFNPTKYRLDMTNYFYQHKISETTQTINGFEYVNSFTFPINAQSSVAIKFYKLTVSENNTYPLGNNQSPAVQFAAS